MPAIFFVVLAPAPAGAHPYVVQVVPGPGTVVRTPPAEIEIAFTERVVLEGSRLELTDAEDRKVVLGPLREPKGGPGLAADVEEALPGAVYTVSWTVLGDDGHTASGDYRFAAPDDRGRPPPGAENLSATGGPADQAPASEGPFRVLGRWIGLLGAALLLGGAALGARLRGRLDPDTEALVAARGVRLGRIGWILALIGAVASVAAAASAGAGGPRLEVALATSTGTLALARLAGVVVGGLPALAFRPGRRRDDLLGAVGALFLGVEAASGHLSALTSGRLPAGMFQALHLVAAGVWVGGLGTLAYGVAGVPAAARAGAWRMMARAFSPLAAGAAAVVVITGTVAAVREVDHRYFLRYSAYGQFLLVKLALVAGMLVLGGVAGRALARKIRATEERTAARTLSLGGMLRSEATLGIAVLLLAATLAGVAQGRGQPLPAQRGSVLAGPAFANAVVGQAVVRLALAPAAPGRNRLTVVSGGATGAGAEAAPTDAEPASTGETPAPPPTRPLNEARSLEASLSCACASEPVKATLKRGDAAWHTDVDLPTAGVWRASLTLDGQAAVAPVALRVDDAGAPGAAPVVVAGPADLSGADARRCRSFQLGMVLALGFLNADGGVGGRKVVLEASDDGGDPDRARASAERLGQRAHLAAPCGRGAASAGRAFGSDLPVVVADPSIPPFEGERVFRLAGDPYAEGWAVARVVIRSTFRVAPGAPRSVAVLSEAGDPSTERTLAGLRAGLDLDPDVAEKVEGERPPEIRGVKILPLVWEKGAPLAPLLQSAIDSTQHVASLLRIDPDELAPGLDSADAAEIRQTNAVVVPNRHFDEGFYLASELGRRGGIIVLGEVAPDSAESLVYTKLVLSFFTGERPTIDGLRGYLAGKAIAEGLRGGPSAGEIARRLRLLGPFSDGVVSGWSPAAAAAGSWRFLLYRGNFVPMGLIPGDDPAPGRFFDEGAWTRVETRNVGLCSPQKTFAPSGKCTPSTSARGDGDQKETG